MGTCTIKIRKQYWTNWVNLRGQQGHVNKPGRIGSIRTRKERRDELGQKKHITGKFNKGGTSWIWTNVTDQ